MSVVSCVGAIVALMLGAIFTSYLAEGKRFGMVGHLRTLEENLPGEEKILHTHLGGLPVRIIGKEGPGVIPVIALAGASLSVQNEWIPVAKKLSENGFVVFIPNFHSNKRARREAVTLIHEAIIRNSLSQGKAIIMGKSLGGSLAQSFAKAYPEEVSKLVLVAPAVSNQEAMEVIRQKHISVFLGLIRDDSIVPFTSTSDAWKLKINVDHLTVFSTEEGGHRIVDAFIEPICKFLTE